MKIIVYQCEKAICSALADRFGGYADVLTTNRDADALDIYKEQAPDLAIVDVCVLLDDPASVVNGMRHIDQHSGRRSKIFATVDHSKDAEGLDVDGVYQISRDLMRLTADVMAIR